MAFRKGFLSCNWLCSVLETSSKSAANFRERRSVEQSLCCSVSARPQELPSCSAPGAHCEASDGGLCGVHLAACFSVSATLFCLYVLAGESFQGARLPHSRDWPKHGSLYELNKLKDLSIRLNYCRLCHQ